MEKKLRFGIVGCGVIGPVHAEAITRLSAARLVAVADQVVERATELSGRYGVTAYESLQAMLDAEDLDVVGVCTPSGLHGEHAAQVMRSGRHVIVEKPMEITLAAMDQMLDVQRETGVKLGVISQHRFDPATMRVRALVEDGELGRLVRGTAHVPWWRSQAYYDSGGWRGTWTLDGGGALMNQAIHSIDLLQWLMGSVRSIYAYTDTLAHRIETEDTAVAVLRFENGALGMIGATTGAYPGMGARVEVLGNRGAAVIENDRLAYLHLARDDREEVGAYGRESAHVPEGNDVDTQDDKVAVGRNASALSVHAHTLQISDFIRAVRDNGTPLVDGEEGRRPVEVILAIYESARTRREVFLT